MRNASDSMRELVQRLRDLGWGEDDRTAVAAIADIALVRAVLLGSVKNARGELSKTETDDRVGRSAIAGIIEANLATKTAIDATLTRIIRSEYRDFAAIMEALHKELQYNTYMQQLDAAIICLKAMKRRDCSYMQLPARCRRILASAVTNDLAGRLGPEDPLSEDLDVLIAEVVHGEAVQCVLHTEGPVHAAETLLAELLGVTRGGAGCEWRRSHACWTTASSQARNVRCWSSRSTRVSAPVSFAPCAGKTSISIGKSCTCEGRGRDRARTAAPTKCQCSRPHVTR